MSDELVVIAALFDGVRVNQKLSKGVFTPEWADRLYRGCRRNWEGDFRMVLLTDYEAHHFKEPVECVPYWYKPHRDSWMGITEVFRPDMPFDHALFMGLDTIIVGSLQDIGSWRGDMAMVSNPFGDRADKGAEVCNAVVAFRRESVTQLWDEYIHDPEEAERTSTTKRSGGLGLEMEFWRRRYKGEIGLLDELYPGQILSYNIHVRSNPALRAELEAGEGDTRIVYFHSAYKPHTVSDSWVQNAWR